MASTSSSSKSNSLGDRVRSLQLPPQQEMRRRSAWRSWPVWLLVAGLAIIVGWQMTRGTDTKPDSADKSEPTADAIATPTKADTPSKSSTTAPAPRTSSSAQSARGDVYALESDGNVVPRHQILVSPKVSGMIVKLDVEEGRRVQKGQLLAELESTDYQADLQRAKAQLAFAQQQLREYESGNRPEEIEVARADLDESIARRKQLKAELKRRETLKANKAVSESEFDMAESDYHAMDRRVVKLENQLRLMVEGVRKEVIERARAQVAQAESDVVKTKWRLDNTRIVAPISGMILKKNAEEGNIVNPIAFNGSFSICDMADLSDLEVDLEIQERDISKIHVGQVCQIKSKAYPDRRYKGVVNRMMPIANRAKQSVAVRVKLEIPDEEEGIYLKPEMTVTVGFLKDVREDADSSRLPLRGEEREPRQSQEGEPDAASGK